MSFNRCRTLPAITPPAVANGIICVGCSDGNLYAVDLNTGQQQWKFEIGPLQPFSSSSPAIANGVVYIGSSDNILYALNAQTGQQLWTLAGGNMPLYSPAITSHVVCVGSSDSPLYALNVKTGEQLGTFETGDMRRRSDPVIADGTVYVGGLGFLQALNLETRKELWQFKTPKPEEWMLKPQFWLPQMGNQLVQMFTGITLKFDRFSSPVIVDDVVYVASRDKFIYALH